MKSSSLAERTVSSVGKNDVSAKHIHSSRNSSCTKRAGKNCGIFALLVAISTIIALFSLPIIFNFVEVRVHLLKISLFAKLHDFLQLTDSQIFSSK